MNMPMKVIAGLIVGIAILLGLGFGLALPLNFFA